jgi:hypothetical protein
MLNNFALATLAGVAASKPLGARPTGGLNAHIVNAYNGYINTWNKSPTRSSEYRERIGIYQDNKKYVEETNAKASGPNDLTLTLNKFADMPQSEVNKHMGLRPDIA